MLKAKDEQEMTEWIALPRQKAATFYKKDGKKLRRDKIITRTAHKSVLKLYLLALAL